MKQPQLVFLISTFCDINPRQTMENIPDKPKNSFRVTLVLSSPRRRIDQVLIEELRKQNRNLLLKNISRTEFKEIFKKKRVRIKGQAAQPSSALAQGTTFVDILGFEDKDN
jgi:hypothetical protein